MAVNDHPDHHADTDNADSADNADNAGSAGNSENADLRDAQEHHATQDTHATRSAHATQDTSENDTRRSPQEIAGVLRERIRVGELKAGDRLPTQAELVEEFGVERGAVRQALHALREDGLLTHVSKGSPPRVAEHRTDPDRSRAARVVLISYLAEAFRAPRVRVDALCFTAETLLWAIGQMCTAVGRGDVRPQSVEVRCLLPGPEVGLPYPVPVDGDAGRAEQLQSRLKQQIKDQTKVMDFYVTSVLGGYGVDAKVTFKPLPFVPSVKQYVLNGTLALQGNYRVSRIPYEELPDVEPFDVLDVSGFNSSLFEFRRDRGGQDAAIVEDIQNCFDALWESS
ncbi:GntR family transcriptional regulator [Streptomyces sp. NPDC059477]|uniref:GntR family transcriptional regulator n=1 Tax=Streptomyces sp. NPDC059477 TaxID=3346847 RepID=UPI00368F31B5